MGSGSARCVIVVDNIGSSHVYTEGSGGNAMPISFKTSLSRLLNDEQALHTDSYSSLDPTGYSSFLHLDPSSQSHYYSLCQSLDHAGGDDKDKETARIAARSPIHHSCSMVMRSNHHHHHHHHHHLYAGGVDQHQLPGFSLVGGVLAGHLHLRTDLDRVTTNIVVICGRLWRSYGSDRDKAQVNP